MQEDGSQMSWKNDFAKSANFSDCGEGNIDIRRM